MLEAVWSLIFLWQWLVSLLIRYHPWMYQKWTSCLHHCRKFIYFPLFSLWSINHKVLFLLPTAHPLQTTFIHCHSTSTTSTITLSSASRSTFPQWIFPATARLSCQTYKVGHIIILFSALLWAPGYNSKSLNMVSEPFISKVIMLALNSWSLWSSPTIVLLLLGPVSLPLPEFYRNILPVSYSHTPLYLNTTLYNSLPGDNFR